MISKIIFIVFDFKRCRHAVYHSLCEAFIGTKAVSKNYFVGTYYLNEIACVYLLCLLIPE